MRYVGAAVAGAGAVRTEWCWRRDRDDMIEWSDEQRQMQAAVREFVQKEVVPGVTTRARRPRRRTTCSGRTCARSASTRWPGNASSGRARRTTVHDRGALRPGGDDAAADGRVLPSLPRHDHGDGRVDEPGRQRGQEGHARAARAWALPLLTLEQVGAWAITEPDSGSDAFGGMRRPPCATATRSCSTAPRRSSPTGRTPTRRCSSASSTTASRRRATGGCCRSSSTAGCPASSSRRRCARWGSTPRRPASSSSPTSRSAWTG